MKLAIYGSGRFGSFVGQMVEKSPYYGEEPLYIDNNPSASISSGIVVTADVFAKEWMDRVDNVLVCSVDYRIRQEMVKSLLKVSFKNIYIVDHNVWYGKLPIFDNDGCFLSYVRKLEDVKPILPYFEYHITDYCNLKCKNCGHHSNEVKTMTFSSLDTFEESLSGLADKFENIETIRLLGGEPLLAPNIHEYADKVLQFFPMSRIKIVTNGLLLTKIRNASSQYLSKHSNIEIQVTQYPPTRKKAEQIIAFCREKHINLSISPPVEYFNVYGNHSSFENTPEAKDDVWRNCPLKDCHFLREHRLFFCITAWVEEEYYGKDMSNASFDIVSGKESGWEILSKLENPFFLCTYCRSSFPQEKWSAPGYNINSTDKC